jgi:hypothetical protein
MNVTLKTLGLTTALALVAGVVSAQEFSLNLSTSQTLQDPLVIAMQGAEQRIEERSEGRVDVTIYPTFWSRSATARRSRRSSMPVAWHLCTPSSAFWPRHTSSTTTRNTQRSPIPPSMANGSKSSRKAPASAS